MEAGVVTTEEGGTDTMAEDTAITVTMAAAEGGVGVGVTAVAGEAVVVVVDAESEIIPACNRLTKQSITSIVRSRWSPLSLCGLVHLSDN